MTYRESICVVTKWHDIAKPIWSSTPRARFDQTGEHKEMHTQYDKKHTALRPGTDDPTKIYCGTIKCSRQITERYLTSHHSDKEIFSHLGKAKGTVDTIDHPIFITNKCVNFIIQFFKEYLIIIIISQQPYCNQCC
jgi:hypothetical protein